MKSLNSITLLKRKRFIILIIFVTFFLGIAVGWYYFEKYSKQYIKPDFETCYTEGIVDVAEEYRYSEVDVSKEYSVGSCATPRADCFGIDLYFSNPKKNNAYLKCVISDENGNKIGESGIIKPGCYIKTIQFSEPLEKGSHKLTVKVLGFEPETYFSKGTAKFIIDIDV